MHPRSLPIRRIAFTVVLALITGAAVAETHAAQPSHRAIGAGTAEAAENDRITMSPAAPAADPATVGLRMVANEHGLISRSVAAVVSQTAAGGTLTAHKPAAATVRKAYMAYATTGYTSTALIDPITIDGLAVPLTNRVPNGVGSYNYFADVTSLVTAKLNAAPAGPVTFTVVEPDPLLVDGEILVVIYDDPAVTVRQSVTLLYGALNPAGDSYDVHLASPVDLSDTRTRLEMSLGISYSDQTSGAQQYSTVDVDGKRLTSAAGGEDDGLTEDGALLSVGGDNDSIADPADPMAPPSSPGSDDELYDLRPFVTNGDTDIHVATQDPSRDDNVFLATLATNPEVQATTTAGVDSDGDGIPDIWEVEGVHGPDGEFIDLPAMGADPHHKDVFLRVDAEKGAALSNEAKKTLVSTFSNAPISNPDGKNGISLHVIAGATLSGTQSNALKAYATANTLTGPDWTKLFANWATSDPAQVSVFHYAVSVNWGKWFAYQNGKITGTILGMSANVPAQTLIVNQCGPRLAHPLTCPSSDAFQAGNLTRELAHNLGLRADGYDWANLVYDGGDIGRTSIDVPPIAPVI